jgi:DNA polymerase-3 subunit epsilon
LQYAITDIETTGESTARGGITEICVYITDGQKVTKKFSSLINPMRRINPSVISLTGITDSMVAKAPTFAELAEELHHLFSGKVFVAHNVNFDFRFIEKAFADLGISFTPKKMCTVKLARAAFPGLPSYSLGKLCDSIGIAINHRHRAEGDVIGTTALFHQCMAIIPELDFKKQIHGGQVLPPHLSQSDINNLPETPGIYRFLDKSSKIKYIGKASNIKKRVLQHFGKNSARNSLELEKIHEIQHLETGNELHALLQESNEIDKNWPEWNVLGKKPSKNWRMIHFESQGGLNRIELMQNVKNAESAFIFKSKALGEALLNRIKKTYEICIFIPQFSGKFCSEDCYCHLKDTERNLEHNARMAKVWEHLHNSENTEVLVAKGRSSNEKAYAVFVNSCLHHWGYTVDDISHDLANMPFQKNSALAQSISMQYLQHAKLNSTFEYQVYILKNNQFQPCS